MKDKLSIAFLIIVYSCLFFSIGEFITAYNFKQSAINAGVAHYVFDDKYGSSHFEFITNYSNITTNK